MIGVIFSAKKLQRAVNGKEPYENMKFYFALAKEKEIQLFFYPFLTVNNDTASGYLWDNTKDKFVPYRGPIPKVNMIRTIVPKRLYPGLKRLENSRGITFLNLVPGRNKLKLYHYLREIPELKEHIPETELLSYSTVLNMLKRNHKVMIKKINGALGEKIYVLCRKRQDVLVQYTQHGEQLRKIIPLKHFKRYFSINFKSASAYLMQPYIPFKRFEGEKFDIRTSVQKNKAGEWNITGIVSRVAGKDGIVTNVAQGGRVVPYKQLLPILDIQTKKKIKELSLLIAKEIERLYPASSDLGLDLAIDEENHIWFIEANYCDQRYAYREAKEYKMWEASYRTPFQFAFGVYEQMLSGQNQNVM